MDLNFVGNDDINFLYLNGLPQAIGTYGRVGNPNSTFDTPLITGDGVLNVLALGPALPGVDGDYNGNGVVDAADYAVWRNNVGTTNVLPNDPTGGTIGATQYNTWKANFGKTPGSGSGSGLVGAVPEPGTVGLLLVAVLWGMKARRRISRGA